MQTLRIGSRVRYTDDSVEGRIIWANGVSVKIRWDDGEQVTWRRDSLADRPIEILNAAGDEDQHTATVAAEQTEQAELPQDALATPATEPVPAEQPAEPLHIQPTEMPETGTLEQAPVTEKQPEAAPMTAPLPETPTSAEQAQEQPQAPTTATKPPRTRLPKKTADSGKEKKLSALDAAAKVLAETGQAMSCPALIAAMASKGYWTSPGGKTPQGTLYSAIAREITTKGTGSRFTKAERGKFALANGQ
jgi:hypothetical protein